ncbi:MAG: adenylate kinase [Candidatus Omnitrophota bacterium]|nr:MAG: adenylate kinase [Candidatus Omnitrophota bacterium]
MNIILFGSPGSGKGTQAKMLGEHFYLRKISLGDILREEVKKDNEIGRQVKKYMEQGVLVPDELVSHIIEDNIDVKSSDNHLGHRGIILDGFPRNLSQARVLEGILNKGGQTVDTFIYLDIDEKTIIDRLSKRRVCKQCGANYHLDTMPPRCQNVCDTCDGELIQRNDDKPSVIKKRREVFLEESKKLLDFYAQKDKLLAIDGRGTKEEVFDRIKNELQPKITYEK